MKKIYKKKQTMTKFDKNGKFTTTNFSGRNNPCRHSFCEFVETPQKFLPSFEISTKSIHFLPTKKKIPILWRKFQTNKNTKCLKPVHL